MLLAATAQMAGAVPKASILGDVPQETEVGPPLGILEVDLGRGARLRSLADSARWARKRAAVTPSTRAERPPCSH